MAALCSRVAHRHAARPINSVAHIYDGGAPRHENGPSRRNTAVGLALHAGASVWWALFFESLFGARARQDTRAAINGGAVIAALAYVVDYHVVPRRFRPGFETVLSPAAMLAVYAAVGGGFALGARLHRLYHHQVKDGDERGERRPAEQRPQRAVAMKARRQRLAARGGLLRHLRHADLQPDDG